MAEASQASTPDDINIKIKTMQPATYDIKIPVQITVAELKERLVDIANVPQERQRVIYKGRVLENDQQLSSHGVQEGHTLHLVERVPRPPQPPAGQPAEQPGHRHFPIAMGSLELDTEETDVNALMASIFHQLGGQGPMPGLAPGDGGDDAGEDGQHRRAQEAQFIAQQMMDSLGQGSTTGEPPVNMLASIQSYLDRTEELMQNPTVLLPSLPDPPARENELREQRRLMEAVRAILTPSVLSELGSEQQAYLRDPTVWEPPAPSAGSSSRQSTASRSAPAQAAVPAGSSASASAAPSASSSAQSPADATAQDQTAAAAAEDTDASAAATGSAAPQQPVGQQQHGSSSSRNASEIRRDAPSGDNAGSADGHRRRRSRGPAISPVVTMALGSLLQRTLEGDAFCDPEGVLASAADTLLSSHSFERAERQQILVGSALQNHLMQESLRAAGSHLYRLAPLLLELARAFSGAVAAMQGQAAPLALNGSAYIRADGPAVAALPSCICAAGSAPAIGHIPAGNHQQIIGSMSIPLFPGMPGVAMHMGPGGPAPNMSGPAASAPAANGPAGPSPARPSPARPSPASAGGRGAGSGAAPPAGAGQGAGRGQGMGLNQALSIALQSAMAQAGGQAGRPGSGVAMTETRQVIQVPGAPPISIRVGARPMAPQRGAEAQQAPDVPVSLQVADGAPVSLAPLIQAISSMLGSAIRSAVASATPPSANPATASATTSAAPSAAASTAPAAAATGSQAQPGSNSRTPASASGSALPESLLAQPVLQQLSRALMHVIGPLVTVQAAAPPSTPAAAAAAGGGAVAEAGRPGLSQDPPAAGSRPSSAAAGTTSTPSDARVSGSRSATQQPLGLSEPLSEMIGPTLTEHRSVQGAEQGAADEQGCININMGAGTSSADASGRMAAPNQPGATSATQAAETDTPQAPKAASLPYDIAEASAPAAAAAAAAAAGDQRRSQRAMGLGSALPPREKGSKKSHPRSSQPNTLPNSPDEAAAGSRQVGNRPGPSVPQQDNVKRARHGDTISNAPSTSAAGTGVQPAAPATAGLNEEEEIPRPSRGAVQAGSAGGLDAMLAQMFGGGGGSAGGTGSGGLNLNSLVQGGGSGQLGQGAGASGQGASGLLGTLAQSIGPMMQQLMVGDDCNPNALGPTSSAPMRSSTADWKSALTELDGEEQAEWENFIRADLQKQSELAPQKYKDHSTAYLAGRPPSAKNSFLPEEALSTADQADSD